MWEIGVAHAFRQPSEVILLRSDDVRLLFDIGPIRVHKYDPTQREASRQLVESLIRDSIAATEQAKGLLVEKTIRALDPGAFVALINQVPMDAPSGFLIEPTMGNQQIFPLLFRLGILELAPDTASAKDMRSQPDGQPALALSRARLTPFGQAVVTRLMETSAQILGR